MAARRPLIHTNGDLKELPDADHADLSIGAAFTPVAAPAHQEGYVFYDTDKKSLSYYNDEADIIVNMGQETLVRVRNTTGVTINHGEAVYINGSQGANLPTVALAQANALAPSRAIGLATHDIENNSNGYITSLGTVVNLDTSAFAAGDALYLSSTTPGALTNTKPTSGYIVLLGYCTISHVTAGEIKVIPQQSGLDLLDLQDFNKVSYSGIGGSFMFIDPNETYADVIPNSEMYWDVSNKRLSIMYGTVPLYTLHVQGESDFWNSATDPVASIYGAVAQSTITNTAANTRYAVGQQQIATTTGAGNTTGGPIAGSYLAEHVGTGTVSQILGFEVYTELSNAVGVCGDIIGFLSDLSNYSAAATVTNVKGAEIALSANSGTITNTYGLYLGDLTAGTQTNTPYGVYQLDTGAHNFFGGKVGVGVAIPAYLLESNAEIGFGELSADPANPAEGKTVIWQSDGTGTGDDGDIYVKTTAGAVTKTIQITDFSAGTGGGGGGASDLTGLTDTPAAYTGEVGKLLVVNKTEDGVEFGPTPESHFYAPGALVDQTGSSTSVSAYATKGNFADVLKDGKITHVKFSSDTNHAGEVFVATVDGRIATSTVLTISKGSYSSVTTGSGNSNIVKLDTPLEVNTGDQILIGVTRTDATATDHPGTYWQSAGNYSSTYIETGTGIEAARLADNDITVGQALTGLSTVSDNWTVGIYFEEQLGALVPAGGTTGQVLSKNSGSDFDLAWTDQSGGGAPTLEDFPVGYVELGTLDYGTTASNSDAFDVTGYEEVLIEHQKCTHGAGEWEVNLSDDGGLTYHATSGDYKRGALYGAGGESDTSATGFRMSVNAGSNLHGITTIHNLGSSSGRVWAYSVGSKMAGTYGVGWQYFNTTGGPFTHIRIRNASSNNSTAGTVKIWGKVAPVAPQVQPTEITAATYSTVNTDFGGNVIRRINHATGCTVTVEPSMTSKQPLTFIQTGAGQITFAAGTGVTINSADSYLKTRAQYSGVQLIPDLDTANTYYLVGDTAA